jgi:hypothetical protein
MRIVATRLPAGPNMVIDDDISNAFHEAGHVVIGYKFGWHLRHGGVCIGKIAEARLRINKDARVTVAGLDTERAHVIGAMAGWVADAKYRGCKSLVAYDEIIDWIKRIRGLGRLQPASLMDLALDSDPQCIARKIVMSNPYITCRAARRLLRQYERETTELIDRPRIWSAIERVSAALVRRRQLSHTAVVRLLGRG